MQDLPADLADPLHLADPYPFYGLLGALATLLLLALLTVLWWRRRRRTVAAALPPAPAPPTGASSGIWKAIEDVRLRFFRSQDYRRGCHALAALLRAHLEGTTAQPLSTLTAREMPAAIGDGAVASFFELLAELQFRRRRPTLEEFRGACDLAHAVVGTKP